MDTQKMTKVIQVQLQCPECGFIQTYHSHKKSIKGQRRKKCERCKKSFKVRGHEYSNEQKHKDNDKPEGFFKYKLKS